MLNIRFMVIQNGINFNLTKDKSQDRPSGHNGQRLIGKSVKSSEHSFIL